MKFTDNEKLILGAFAFFMAVNVVVGWFVGVIV